MAAYISWIPDRVYNAYGIMVLRIERGAIICP